MTFWGKNSVIVPLETLINKEKENTSRPVAARSCGSVGRWGKMGFTSTRTYALKVPSHLSPVAAQSPDQIASPPGANSSNGGAGSSPPSADPPKPKKFFKSRNTTAPLDFIRSQFMQHHMAHIAPVSPGYALNVADALPPPSQSSTTNKDGANTTLKIKISKNKKRRESKEPKEKEDQNTISPDDKDHSMAKERKERKKSTSSIDKAPKSPKPSKKKKEKQLKPEAPPSRVLGRNRKPVNYNEDDDSIPYRPSEVPETSDIKPNKPKSNDDDSNAEENSIINDETKDIKEISKEETVSSKDEPVPEKVKPENNKRKTKNKDAVINEIKQDNLENDDSKSITTNNKINNTNNLEHPPIVLRISKGTSRLISTDSEDGKLNQTTPIHETNRDLPSTVPTQKSTEPPLHTKLDLTQTKISSTEELLSVLSDDKPDLIPPLIVNKKTRKKSTTTNDVKEPVSAASKNITEASNNISTVTPVQEEQKPKAPASIIYPADTIPDINYEAKISPDKPPKERLKLIIKTDVLRKALAAEAEKAEKKKEKEKNKKHKHHHHHHHHHHKSITLKITNTEAQFKTPSPQPVVINDSSNCDLYKQLSINSPSERDFDSQSSVLGSVSSKTTAGLGQYTAVHAPDESCVIRSRGSSDITSDLETSQHSSLVAPPSDIESRLESMMDPEDETIANVYGTGKKSINIKLKLIEQEPLKEDILEVLTGGNEKENAILCPEQPPVLIENNNDLIIKKNNIIEEEKVITDQVPPVKVTVSKKVIRNRKNAQDKQKDEISSVEAVKGSDAEPSITSDSVESEQPVQSTIKPTGRSLRVRTNNTNIMQGASVSVDLKLIEEEPLKSPVRKGQRNAKKISEPVTEPEINELELIKEEIPAISARSARAARNQKAKANEIENEEQPLRITIKEKSKPNEKVRGGRKIPSTTSVTKQLQEPVIEQIEDKNESEEAPKTETKLPIRSSRRIAAKLDPVPSSTLPPTKSTSPVKIVPAPEELTLPVATIRKGRITRKAAINNLKGVPDQEIETVSKIETENNLQSETILKVTHPPPSPPPSPQSPPLSTSPPLSPSPVQQQEAQIIAHPPPTRSYGSRKRKPQTDVILSDITPPPPTKQMLTTTSIDLPVEPSDNVSETTLITKINLPDESVESEKSTTTLEPIKSTQTTTEETITPSQPPIKEYKVNKFKRAWYERDSKTNLENERPLENAPIDKHTVEGEPVKKSPMITPQTATTVNNVLEKLPKSKTQNKILNNNTETSINVQSGLESTGSSNSNGNLDDKQIKLVISKKKGSIFKSRALVAEQGGITSQEKKRHTYVHKWDAKDEQEANSQSEKTKESNENPESTSEKEKSMDYEDEDDQPLALSTRYHNKKLPTRPNLIITSTNNKFNDNMELAPGQTKVDKNTKEYYTVIRNVKTAHQIQEIGEYQEMDDDVEYILDALQPRNPISTRCLSALQLATKCMTPAFRMHVRAHGTVTKFFKVLQDAKSDRSLGLCTAAIMFVLSQDTLNMDLDRDSLELMMNLLESDIGDSTDSNVGGSSSTATETTTYERNKQKVRELCEEIKAQGKGAHLNLEAISAGTLAMETLLSLTSKRAGEWFKEELRELGGLEHIIKTICDCCHQISDYVVSWTEILLEKLKTIERCLRVLENVSLLNEVNQSYILKYGNGHAINTLFKFYKLCDSEIALYPTSDLTPKDNPGVVLREALVPTLKVLINLTHPFNDKALGSTILGQRKGIFDTSFHILLQAPNYVPERCIFELSILVLLLLINLTMYTIPNRQQIMKSHAPCDFGNQFDKQPAIKALIEYFYRCEEQARQAEKNTDAILENPLEKKKAQSQEEVDETVTKLLQKAGHHMEHTLQASYAGILIGHLISDNKENEQIIRSYLRENSFSDIIKVLEKYYNFMNLTASSEATVVAHIKSTKKLIDYYKQCESHSNSEEEHLEQEQITGNNTSMNSSSCSNSSIGGNNSGLNLSKSQNSDSSDAISVEPAASTSSLASSMSTRNNIRVYKTYSQR